MKPITAPKKTPIPIDIHPLANYNAGEGSESYL
jgi:hypothetical protein